MSKTFKDNKNLKMVYGNTFTYKEIIKRKKKESKRKKTLLQVK